MPIQITKALRGTDPIETFEGPLRYERWLENLKEEFESSGFGSYEIRQGGDRFSLWKLGDDEPGAEQAARSEVQMKGRMAGRDLEEVGS